MQYSTTRCCSRREYDSTAHRLFHQNRIPVPQLPEQDMTWLKSWAEAVVHASKTDQSERLDSPSATRSYAGDDTLRGSEGFEGESLERGIQARRAAMKVTVREGYAFSTTAQLWAEEMTR